VTQPGEIQRCRWCGERFAPTPGPGRPRRYCRRSHRQRHYEARRLSERHELGADDVLFRRADLEALRDRIYVLESVIQDVRMDLAASGRLEDYPEALRALTAAAEQVTTARLEPKAAG
jgi:hypothetical protein